MKTEEILKKEVEKLESKKEELTKDELLFLALNRLIESVDFIHHAIDDLKEKIN
jgi:hypothetical protein